jgi:hypothetical protein
MEINEIPYYNLSLLFVGAVVVLIEVVSFNPAHYEVHSIQQYVIKFVSDFRQVGGFLWVFGFPPPIKLTTTI